MGTTSSKPNATARTTSKAKHRTTAVKGYSDYQQQYLPGYWPSGTEATYGYSHFGVGPNYAPVIPPSLMPQYHPYYPAHVPPPITMPQPQPYIPQQPVAQPVIPVTAQPAAQSQPVANQPVIPPAIPPAPPQERPKKRKATRKKMPAAVISFELPNSEHARRPSQTEAYTTPSDLSRSLSRTAPSQQGRTHAQSQTQQTPGSSPIRPYHERRASTHDSSRNHQPPYPSADERPRNPLPKLPVDIFATTPYKHVLEPKELPAWPPLEPGKTFMVQQEVQEPPQQAKKGLFRLRKKNPPPPLSQTKLSYLPRPVSATASNPPTTATTTEPPPTSATNIDPPTSSTTVDTPHTGFQPPPGSDPGYGGFEPPLPPIYFNQDTEYAPFLNHSPHSVSYERVTYPTATHLIEAMKFLPEADHNRDIAELIRKCVDLADVYRLSHEHREAQNEENGESYMAKMERVMYLKFNQHGDLADLLLSTGEASLVYDDPSDSFWGIGEVNGEPGHNELGHMLEVIRARLRHERMK
ncbi:Swarming motility protein ybiA [Termitomyces sp. T112]|nr:Swarming motility protein ybiA [Termitomyces sp. T112]